MTQDELKLVFNALKQCNIFAYAGGLGVRATAHTDALAILEKALAQPEQPPQRKLLTDEKICLIAHNTDPNDWDDLTFKKCWHEGFKAGFREAEIEHNIKG